MPIGEGDRAPDFTVPLADGDVSTYTLSDNLAEAPIVLAFFPGAFTSTCTTEMNAFQERLDEFETAGATVYGVSVDSPFALNEFREKHGLTFGMLSDFEKRLIDDYGVRDNFEDVGVYGLAQRSVFVVGGDRTVTYRWTADDPTREPNYEAVRAAAAGHD